MTRKQTDLPPTGMTKYCRTILLAVFLIGCGYFLGSKEYSIPSLKRVEGITKGRLYDFGAIDQSNFICEFDPSLLGKVLQYYEWKNPGNMSRMLLLYSPSFGIVFEDGTTVHFAGDWFRVSGVPGYFFIQQGHVDEAKKLLGQLLEDFAIPYRKRMQEISEQKRVETTR